MTAVGTDTAIPLASPATLSCGMTIALSHWIGDAVLPAAKKYLETAVVGLPAGVSYACRGRNDQADARLSEHAFANAFDLPGFILANGKTIGIGPHDGNSRKDLFLTEIRMAACGPFGTVLGPGADDYHDDHFHLDAHARNTPYCR